MQLNPVLNSRVSNNWVKTKNTSKLHACMYLYYQLISQHLHSFVFLKAFLYKNEQDFVNMEEKIARKQIIGKKLADCYNVFKKGKKVVVTLSSDTICFSVSLIIYRCINIKI